MSARGKTDVRLVYALYGALFGLTFPVMATLFDAFIRDMGYGLDSLIEVQKTIKRLELTLVKNGP